MVKVRVTCVLWHLTFVGFAVNYMIRINLNITIVEMIASKVEKHPANSQNALVTSNFIQNNRTSNLVAENSVNFENERKKFTFEKSFLKFFNIEYDTNGFDWDEYQQGLVLGSFFWLHWVTQIPGGVLATQYGTKLVFGLSNAVGCWICFLIPLASYWDYKALIFLRVLQGLITGLSWPAMHVLTAKWIPPNERSKFVTAYLGSSVGIAIFYPLFGYMLHWASWEWVYHICGVLGTIWWLFWVAFVYDTPSEHPRISLSELTYIEKSLGSTVIAKNVPKAPWGSILKSRPVWMNVIAQWGGIWGLFTLMTQAPTYFRVVHNWDVKATGILSGLPHLMRMIFAYLFSLLVDSLLHRKVMSRNHLRKLATAVCCIVNGLMVLALAYFGHNATAAIVFLTAATMFHGAVSSGPLASIVDIAPNYAGVVLGVSGMVSVLPGFISPYIVGVLTLGNQTFEAWRHVFTITAAMLIGSGVLYVLFGESTLQPWNTREPPNDVQEEMQTLKEKQTT